MNILGLLGKIRDEVNPFDGGKTWANPTGSPRLAGESIWNPIRRGVKGAAQTINPFDAESRGNAAVNKASSIYGFTPEFKGLLDYTNPSVAGGAWQNSEGLKQLEAAGMYFPKEAYSSKNNRINIAPGQGPNTLLHEGLHAGWDANEASPSDFGYQYNKNIDKELASWLARRTGGYKANKNLGYKDFLDIRNIPRSLQGEVHSFLPEYYDTFSSEPMPQGLSDYYSRYYSPEQHSSNKQVARNIYGLLNLSQPWRE